MFCSQRRVCDPFRVGRFGYPVSGGVAALNPRLISRIPSGCRSAALRAVYFLNELLQCPFKNSYVRRSLCPPNTLTKLKESNFRAFWRV